MSLQDCPACGNEVSARAQSCPKCGEPLKKKKTGLLMRLFQIFFLLPLGIGLVAAIFSPAKDTPPQSARTEQKASAPKKVDPLEAKFGAMPSGGFDGVPREVKSYLKGIARNPASVDVETCTDVSVDQKNGWIVGCTWLGQNGFGGMNKESNWFVIKNRTVIKMLPFSAYKQ
jgi:hypothetical protein